MKHKKHIVNLSALVLVASLATFSSPTRAQNPTDSPAFSSEEAWKKTPVTLDASDATAKAILEQLADQVELGLAVTASSEDLEQNLTVRVKNRPAEEVVEIIGAGLPRLNLEIKNSVLLVTSKIPERLSVAPERGRFFDGHRSRPHERREKKKREKRKGRVEFGGDIVVEKDEHYRSVVALGGNNTVFGHVDKDAVSIGGTLVVKSGAQIEGTAVSVGGSVIIESGARVEEEAVSVGGSVIIESGAEVEEDAVSVGGSVDLSDDAKLGGSRVSIGVPMPPMAGAAGAVGGLILLHIVSAIFRSVMLLAAALLLLWLVPRNIEGVGGYILKKPGISILSGFLLFLAMIPLFALLAVSIIGIPLIPIAVVAVGILVVLGLTAMIAEIGKKMPFLKSKTLSFKTVFVGFIVFLFINIVPIIGGLFCMICTLWGAGAAFQSRFGRRPVN